MEPAVRELSAAEAATLQQLAQSRTAPARLVERAQIIRALSQGATVAAVARQQGVDRRTVELWRHRFNEQGMVGLKDRPRSGCPRTYTAEQVSEVIALAFTDPHQLGLPFACWTLDRLQAYLVEEQGVGMKRSRIDELLLQEGLRWRQQETWFGERVDPDFVRKRGRSSACTPSRRQAA